MPELRPDKNKEILNMLLGLLLMLNINQVFKLVKMLLILYPHSQEVLSSSNFKVESTQSQKDLKK